MRRNSRVAVIAAVAVLMQTALLNRLALPAGASPDLVLIVVVGAALAAGPTSGAVCGFACGLALDLLPPAEGELGRQAVVLCLVGFLAGRLEHRVRRSPPLAFGAVALAVPLAAAVDTALGALVSDPRASLGALLGALPTSLAATMILSPFVLFLLHRLLGRAVEDELAYIGVSPSARGGRP